MVYDSIYTFNSFYHEADDPNVHCPTSCWVSIKGASFFRVQKVISLGCPVQSIVKEYKWRRPVEHRTLESTPAVEDSCVTSSGKWLLSIGGEKIGGDSLLSCGGGGKFTPVVSKVFSWISVTTHCA